MSFERLYKEAISTLLCSQCGACEMVCPKRAITMQEEEDGIGYAPVLTGDCLGEKCSMCSDACPGAYIPMGELEEKFLGRRREGEVEQLTGMFRRCTIGWVQDPELRNLGGSGTVTTALLLYAYQQGIIDAVVASDWDEEKPWQGVPTVAADPEKIVKCASTKYDPQPVLRALREAVEKGYQKIAVVGCPCVIASIRKMQTMPKYKKYVGNIVFTIGLFCFSCFTRRGCEWILKEQLGVKLEDIKDFRYRDRPWPGFLRATLKNGEVVGEPWISFRMAGRMMSTFKPEGCMTCLDVYGELADFSVGDGWGHEASDKEAKETGNIPTCTFIRTEFADRLFKEMEDTGVVRTITVPHDECGFVKRNGAAIHKKMGHEPRVRQRKRYGFPYRHYE